MKDKGEGSGGGGGQQAPGGAATTTKRSKKNKGRHFTLSIGPLPQPKFNAIVCEIHKRKQAEAAALREQIVANAKHAKEVAWRAEPTVLETGLDALDDFDAWGRPRSASAVASAAAAVAPALAAPSVPGAAAADGDAGGKEERKDGAVAEGGGGGDARGRKRQRTMADVVQLHRKLSDLQKARTELRWLMEEVERLEYEAL